MISIIIPLYNKEKCIRKTIDSILNQKNFSDFEVVVVDDGSTDKSCEIVASYQDPRIKLYKKKNGGPSSARNYGVQKAEGQWIIYLDADDTFFDYTLSLFHKTSLKHPQYNCFSGNIARVDDKGLRVVNPMAEGEITNPYRAWLTKRFCSRTGAAMYRKYILTKYPFDERYRRFEDLEQSLRIMKNEKFYNLSTPVMVYNQISLAASLNKNIETDFLGNLNINGAGAFWEKVFYVYLYKRASTAYPDEAKRRYSVEDYNKIIYEAALLLCRCEMKLRKVLKHNR